MPSESIFFHKGISSQVRSALNEPGSLKTCVNISLEKEGEQTVRQLFTAINSTAVGPIHSIYKWGTMIIVGDGTHLRYSTGGEFTDLYASFTDAPWQFKQYKDFLHGVNGYEEVLIDDDGNCYPAIISNPETAATLADSGIEGNPDGVYAGYVSYFITWPNGMTYETGFGDASNDVTVSTNKISWSTIPISTYSAYSGTAPTITRKLYRGAGTGGTLTDIYYVATISDNTTTTYTDDESNVTIQENDIAYNEDYEPLANTRFIDYHYGQAFGIDFSKTHRLIFTETVSATEDTENEVLMPLATTNVNWDDIRVSGFGAVDPQGVIAWGTNIFVALKQTWLKKQGNDSDTWSYKKTWAEYGVGAPYTISLCPQPNGIIALSSYDGGNPGLCLFNGQTSEMFTSPKFDYIFKEELNHTYIENCRGFCAGRYYIFIYPSQESTGTPDKIIAFDLRRFPDIRAAYWEDLNAVCGCSSDQGGPIYIGTSDGYVLKSDSNSIETVDINIETEDRIGGDIKAANMTKVLKQIRYNLSGTANLQVIIDDVAAIWHDGLDYRVITGAGDEIQVMPSLPTNFVGYKFRIRIYATGVNSLTIFSPWEVNFDVK